MTAEKLDELLGDPWDPDNPVGYAAVLAADERCEPVTAGLRLLDDFAFNAELVPAAEGGQLVRADRLAELVRTVCRRDPCLAVDHTSSLIASAGVWVAGDAEQRQVVSDLLLGNGRIAAAFGWPAAGDSGTGYTARPDGTGWLLSGRGELLPELRRSDAVVLVATTPEGPGQFLVMRDGPRGRELPPRTASGLRGARLGGVDFTDHPLPAGALIGTADEGTEIVSRAYRLLGCTASALRIGPLDTALRTALANSLSRRLYGGTAADIPYVAASLARVHADLLALDALASVTARAAHLAPAAMALYGPALDYLAARIVPDAFEELRAVLGARALLRGGPHAIFQKLARDVAVAPASRVACLALILRRLTALAGTDRPPVGAASGGLFDLGGPLPPLDLAAPIDDTDADPVIASLDDAPGPVDRFARHVRHQVRALRQECATLRPSVDVPPAAFALAARYAALLASAAVITLWRNGSLDLPANAVLSVLDRLDRRIGGAPVLTGSERQDAELRLFDVTVERYHDHRLFDLTSRRIPL